MSGRSTETTAEITAEASAPAAAPTPLAPPPVPPAAQLAAPEDLGLSGVFEGEQRFLHRDGRFNSRRVGLGLSAYNPYTWLLSLSWPHFFGVTLAVYLVINGLFALLFYALGPRALSDSPSGETRLLADFFFSVQTFGTIGFGHVYPVTLAANLAVTLEAFVGLMAVALVTGMLFARFSRPRHRMLFSQRALVAPYRGGRGLMFRLMNGHRSELNDVDVEVMLTLRDFAAQSAGRPGVPRQFHRLELERSRVVLFPLAWTLVHAIDETSPLYGLNSDELLRREAELIVIVRATDEISQQMLQTRTSYHSREILWGYRFVPMYVREGNLLAVDARLLDEIQPAELPPPAFRPSDLSPSAV